MSIYLTDCSSNTIGLYVIVSTMPDQTEVESKVTTLWLLIQ